METFNLDKFNAKADELFENIARAIPNTTQGIARTALSMVRDRIQQRGLNAEENELPDYSAAYKKAKGKRIKTDIGYVNNRDVGFTNLTLTGRMWNNMEVLQGESTANGYVVRMGAKAQENDDKAYYNSQRYGDILRVSVKEEETLADDLDTAIQEIINETGF